MHYHHSRLVLFKMYICIKIAFILSQKLKKVMTQPLMMIIMITRLCESNAILRLFVPMYVCLYLVIYAIVCVHYNARLHDWNVIKEGRKVSRKTKK